MMREREYRRLQIIAFSFLLSTILGAGCVFDSSYRAQKLFWEAQQKAAGVIEETGGAPTAATLNELIDIYREVIEAVPLQKQAAQAHFIITNIYFRQGDYDKAQEELKRIIYNFSNTPSIASRAQLIRGKIYEDRNKWNLALEEYDKLIDLYPLTSLGLQMPIYIMEHYRSINDTTGEERAYKRAIRHYEKLGTQYEGTPAAPTVLNVFALAHYQAGAYDAASAVWNEIIREYPQSSEALRSYLMRAQVFIRVKNDIPNAIAVYDEFLARYPENELTPRIKLQKAQLYFAQDKLDEGRDILLDIVEKYAQDEEACVNAYMGLGDYHVKNNNLKKTLEIYALLRQQYPDNATAVATPYLAVLHLEKEGDTARMKTALDEAIAYYSEYRKKRNENIHESLNFLALCYVKKGWKDKAIELLKASAEEYPEDPRYLLGLAKTYSSFDENAEAITVYQEVMDKYPGNKQIQALVQPQIEALREKIAQ